MSVEENVVCHFDVMAIISKYNLQCQVINGKCVFYDFNFHVCVAVGFFVVSDGVPFAFSLKLSGLLWGIEYI